MFLVLLCKTCTAKITVINSKERERIAREYNAPVEGTGAKYIVNKELTKVVGMASTLLTRTMLPPERINEIKKELCVYLQKDEISEEEIVTLSKSETKIANPEHVSHEQIVVNALKGKVELERFIFRWRKHFVENMKPQFMPTYWREDRPLDLQ